MLTSRKLLVTILIVSVLAVASFIPALADSTSGPQAHGPFMVNCGGKTFEAYTPSGPTLVWQVSSSTGNLLLADMTLNIYYTDPETGQPGSLFYSWSLGAAHGKALGLQGKATTCAYHFEFDDPYWGHVINEGDVTVFDTPMRH